MGASLISIAVLTKAEIIAIKISDCRWIAGIAEQSQHIANVSPLFFQLIIYPFGAVFFVGNTFFQKTA
jgi:hypothetical protein